jgi:hypothetical protein
MGLKPGLSYDNIEVLIENRVCRRALASLIIIDANLLLYAYDSAVPEHEAAAAWLNNLFESGKPSDSPG